MQYAELIALLSNKLFPGLHRAALERSRIQGFSLVMFDDLVKSHPATLMVRAKKYDSHNWRLGRGGIFTIDGRRKTAPA